MVPGFIVPDPTDKLARRAGGLEWERVEQPRRR